MSSIALMAIEKKIFETERAIASLTTASNDSLPGFSLPMIHQLENHLKILHVEKQQVIISQTKERVQLRIHGNSVKSGTISAKILGEVLTAWQNVTDSIANTIGNEPTKKGGIPKRILDRVNLQVYAISPGSFCIDLEGDVSPVMSDDMNLLSSSLNRMFKLLIASRNPADVFQEIVSLGPRTLCHYKKLLNTLKVNNINLDMNWVDSSAEKRVWKSESIPLIDVTRILNKISEIVSIEEEHTGRLSGLNIRKETFEFIFDDDRVIHGNSKIDILLYGASRVNTTVSAKLIKTVSLLRSTNEERTTWYLKEIVDYAVRA